MWTACLLAAMRVSGLCGFSLNTCGCSMEWPPGSPYDDSARNAPLLKLNMMPNLASQIRTAFSSIALKTGFKSPGELEMTFSTSEVAVCCSSDSESSCVRACTSSNRRSEEHTSELQSLRHLVC